MLPNADPGHWGLSEGPTPGGTQRWSRQRLPKLGCHLGACQRGFRPLQPGCCDSHRRGQLEAALSLGEGTGAPRGVRGQVAGAVQARSSPSEQARHTLLPRGQVPSLRSSRLRGGTRVQTWAARHPCRRPAEGGTLCGTPPPPGPPGPSSRAAPRPPRDQRVPGLAPHLSARLRLIHPTAVDRASGRQEWAVPDPVWSEVQWDSKFSRPEVQPAVRVRGA